MCGCKVCRAFSLYLEFITYKSLWPFLTSVPQVLKTCAEFIEEHGIVDGIYRLSGVTSNIQRLRYTRTIVYYHCWSKFPYCYDINK